MLGSSSFIVAAASAAGQCGPGAAVLADVVAREIGAGRAERGLSEREMFLARAEAALKAQKAAGAPKSAGRMRRVNWRGVVAVVKGLRPRLAA